MASSVNTGSTVRHAATSKIVITLQSLVILYLSYWIIEEYLNNMYLRQYVSDMFQSNGLIIGALSLLLMVGSASSLMLVRRRHGEKRFGAVSLEVTSSTPKIKLAAEQKTKPAESTPKPTAEFHPVVAALKADMADRRLSFGSSVGSGADLSTKTSVSSTEGQRGSVLDQLNSDRRAPMTGPGPGLAGPPPVPRPAPMLQSQQPAAPTGQTSQPPHPQLPTNITTVITGIMPFQKKKDPNAPAEERPASQ